MLHTVSFPGPYFNPTEHTLCLQPHRQPRWVTTTFSEGSPGKVWRAEWKNPGYYF